ncbi:MAG: ABC transporter permease, partial [Candidatus Aminicenantaceae bacterium]
MHPQWQHPPRLAQKILRHMLLEEEIYEKLGDFEEGYHSILRIKGPQAARAWYRLQVLRLIPAVFNNIIYWSLTMFKNYLKITLRQFRRHLGYSLINVLGLVLGIASCILILAWVKDELSTNRFHEKIDSLYLGMSLTHYGSEVERSMGTVPALGPALKEEYPEVLNAARHENGQGEFLLEYGNAQFKERIQLADPEIFQIFTFPFVQGDPRDTFGDPNVLVLSERTAHKIFGSEDPIGKVLTVNGSEEFRVVGVMRDIPHNSTIRFDVWAPLELTHKYYRPDYLSTWYNQAFRTYFEMADNIDVEAFNEKIFNRVRLSNADTNVEPYIYPFSGVYLDIYGRRGNILTFSLIGLVILTIACINFMNLSTARSAHRAREVGMRKVVGAQRRQIIRQFFGESLIFTLLSLLLALGAVWLLLPSFRTLTGKPLQLSSFWDVSGILGVLGVTLVTGFLAGSYPALFLSAFRPVAVLKGSRQSGAGGAWFRKILVVLQFAMSVMLIIGTLVILLQVRFLKSKTLGFDKERLLYVRLEGDMLSKIAGIKHELTQHPGIQSVSATSHSPTGVYNNGQDWEWEGRDPNVNPLVTYFGVDPDFLQTFQMELAQGESFRPTGHNLTMALINERFADIIGNPNIIGSRLSQEDIELQIIGVIKDFHFTPLYQEIGPAIIYFDPSYTVMQRYRYLFIRLNPGDIPRSIAHIEDTVKTFNPGFPFAYRFLDDDYDQLYRGVEREMAIVRTFAFLAILISCLGLFGLAAYTAEQRTKEIGIRKILGASTPGLLALLSKQYALWVLAANAIAWPVSYFLMKGWLQDYPYRIGLGLPIFLTAAVASLLIAQLTVGFQSLRAARTNPVDSL